MNPLTDILTFIITTLGSLFLIFVVLRFLLQLARADFYNPFSQSVVKITNPVLVPIRKVIPGIFGIDIASIVLALIVQLIVTELNCLILFKGIINPLTALAWGLVATMNVATWVYIVCIIIVVISSFVAPHSHHPLIVLAHQLISPVLRPIQKLIPPAGGLDFSVLFVGMGIYIVQIILYYIAAMLQLNTALVISFF